MLRTISTTAKGTTVTGRYLSTGPSVIEVELTMPDLLPLRYSWVKPTPTRHGNTTSIMIVKPERRLVYLYEIAAHLHEHAEQIAESYRALEIKIAEAFVEGGVPDELFVALKNASRMMVVSGAETEVEHCDDLAGLRVGHSTYHERVKALRDHWFRSLFRRPVDAEVQEQVVAWIRNWRTPRDV